MKTAAAILILAAAIVSPTHAQTRVEIVAAENFYGEAAAAIGGDRVAVKSILSAPGIDPHDYEPAPSVAASVAAADIVILNGADYDHWMERLIEATAGKQRTVIDVASLIGRAAGDNPHVWYDPAAMPALANAVTAALTTIDPEGRTGYEQRRDAFLQSLAPVQERISALRARLAGTPVAATEPVFGYMAEALGFTITNEAFQTAVMNETEPSAADVAAMEMSIREGKVKVLFYNSQVEDPLTERFAEIAKESGVPVVGVTETQPEGATFADWMLGQLDATAKALGVTTT